MACLFEYAILPITVENLLDLSGSDEEPNLSLRFEEKNTWW